MIPEGWTLTTLGEACKGKIQTGPFGSQLHSYEYVEAGIPVIIPKDLLNGRIVPDRAARITQDKANLLEKHKLKIGDIVFSRRGDVSCAAIVKKNEVDYICGTGCLRVRPNKDNVFAPFLNTLVQTEDIKSWLKSNSVGQTMPNMNSTILSNLPLLLPPLPEQRKIAEIVSTWDKAIALLEQLITAKRKLKQGLMQQLLTGKKRFKEFEGSEWAEHQLSEVATITMGTSTNSEAYNIRLWERSFGKPPSNWDYQLLNSFLSERTERQINDGTYPLFSLTIEEGITPKTDRYNREFLLNNAESNEYKVVYPGDIVYNPMNLRFGALAISNLKFAVIVSAYYNVLQIDKLKSNGNFLAYLLLSERLMSVYERVASGPLLEKKRVHFSEFRNIILPLPPLPEQQKIASILSTADSEISNLEKQLSVYKQQKRGLMQQLLTGKKRVKSDEPQMQKV